MLVVVANHIPPAVRGRMKLWFVEPKPHVFVSGVKDSTADKVVDYLFAHCPASSGLLVFQKTRQAPGFKIRSYGDPTKKLIEVSGLQLICEKK